MLAPDEKEMLRDTHRMAKETYLAVCGDEKLGVTGLVKRMRAVERRERRILGWVALISGFATGFSVWYGHHAAAAASAIIEAIGQ